MYGVEWLIILGLLGLAAGAGGGYLWARRAGAGGQRLKELEEQLASARQELEDYRHEVVTQFSDTARKFQTLNDSYTDLHRQLARSSSILCGDVAGPLLAAPDGHQDLLPAGMREAAAHSPTATEAAADESDGHAPHASEARDEEPPTLRERVERSVREQTTSADGAAAAETAPAFDIGQDIRIAEPGTVTDVPRRPPSSNPGTARAGRPAV